MSFGLHIKIREKRIIRLDMKKINLMDIAPDALKKIQGLQNYLQKLSLSPLEQGIIMIRASQLNGCAHCLKVHTKFARQHGENEERIYLLSAWKNSDLFSEKEKTILALTEEITLISECGIWDETYERAQNILGDLVLAEVIMVIVIINAWNRIGLATEMPKD